MGSVSFQTIESCMNVLVGNQSVGVNLFLIGKETGNTSSGTGLESM